MQSEFFSEPSVQHLCDEVLLRCAVQFRQAVGMLERNGVTIQNTYLQEMREGLCTMEAELARRHIFLDSHSDVPVSSSGTHPVLHIPFLPSSAESHQV